jgi:DNA-binding MarR family transcriptional regulator
VDRAVDAADKRIVRVRATPRGVTLLREGRQRRVAALVRDLDALSQRELAALRKAVDVLERVVRRPS